LCPFSVIPAEAGSQYFQALKSFLDPGFHRGDDQKAFFSQLPPPEGEGENSPEVNSNPGGTALKLSEYFQKTTGRGVIATSDSKGKVGIAVYARPHFFNEKTVAFIMADRLIHRNLQSNASAAYLFMESGERYVGKRLYLTKIKEEKDRDLIEQMRRRDRRPLYRAYGEKNKYLVYFRINKVLPLIGDKSRR
jgi:hypothetical protein